MAKVTPVLWKHKANADRLFPVWIRVADRYRTLYHSFGEAIAASHWNPAAKRGRKSHPVADDLNALIQDRLAAAHCETGRLKPRTCNRLGLPAGPSERSDPGGGLPG